MNPTTDIKRKRRRRTSASLLKQDEVSNKSVDTLCIFCQQTPAAIMAKLPHPRFPKRKTITQAFCLRHFYTTPAARQCEKPDSVTILDQAEYDLQMEPMQELFAEAFIQLQQEITEVAAQAFTAQQNDPLAILHDLNKKPKMKKPPPSAVPLNQGSRGDGGFLRDAPLPQRLMRTQQQQAQKQAELTKRMEKAAASTLSSGGSSSTAKVDMSKRRKSSRKSIWNMVRDHPNGSKDEGESASEMSMLHKMDSVSATCPSCGSEEVVSVGSNTSRNQDLKKGETWGMKGREDEVLVRLQCQKCSRVWMEES